MTEIQNINIEILKKEVASKMVTFTLRYNLILSFAVA